MGRWASRNMPGEVGASDADAALKDNAQKAAAAAVGETLEVFRTFYLDGRTFIGGDHVSIADIRLACSLEFLHAIDYDFPAWAKTYMATVETALGDAYAEPAGDVEGYIAVCEGAEEVGVNTRRTVQAACFVPEARGALTKEAGKAPGSGSSERRSTVCDGATKADSKASRDRPLDVTRREQFEVNEEYRSDNKLLQVKAARSTFN